MLTACSTPLDPAFISRVNLGLKIPSMDESTRLKIWKQKFQFSKDVTKNLAKDFATWARHELNARQIRNVAHSARLIAGKSASDEVWRTSVEAAIADVMSFTKMIEQEKENEAMRGLGGWR